MSRREDLSPTRTGWRRVSYTRRCGWIDWGHAQPGAARKLKRLIDHETSGWPMLRDLSITLAGQPAYVLDFGERMSAAGLTVDNVAHFVVRKDLSVPAKASVALAIFAKVSIGFEQLQATPPFSWATDSGFSAEDLVSNLVGFYGVYRLLPEARLREIAGEVSVAESQRIWDQYLPNGIGSVKNRRFQPILFPTEEVKTPRDSRWPIEFTGITPMPAGRDWIAVAERFIDGGLLASRWPLAVAADGRVTLARPAALPGPMHRNR